MRLLGGKPFSGPDQLGFLGSGARIRLSPVRAPPAAIARTEVGYPDPRGPDTFCRELVIEMAGEAIPLRCTKRTPSTSVLKKLLCVPIRRSEPLNVQCTPRSSSLVSGRSRRFFNALYEPTRRGRLREARPRRSHFRGTFRQGRLRRSSAKRSAIGKAQGAFRRGRRSRGMGTCSANRTGPMNPGRLGGCPQVVPSLWKSRRRLFNPCRWNTLRQSAPWQKARTLVSCSCPKAEPGTVGPQRPRRLLRSR